METDFNLPPRPYPNKDFYANGGRPITPPPRPESLDPRLVDVLHKHEAEHIYGEKTFDIEPKLGQDKKTDVVWDAKSFATEYQVKKVVQDQLQSITGKQDVLSPGRCIQLDDLDGDIYGIKESISVKDALVGGTISVDTLTDAFGEKGVDFRFSSNAAHDEEILGSSTSSIDISEKIRELNERLGTLTDTFNDLSAKILVSSVRNDADRFSELVEQIGTLVINVTALREEVISLATVVLNDDVRALVLEVNSLYETTTNLRETAVSIAGN